MGGNSLGLPNPGDTDEGGVGDEGPFGIAMPFDLNNYFDEQGIDDPRQRQQIWSGFATSIRRTLSSPEFKNAPDKYAALNNAFTGWASNYKLKARRGDYENQKTTEAWVSVMADPNFKEMRNYISDGVQETSGFFIKEALEQEMEYIFTVEATRDMAEVFNTIGTGKGVVEGSGIRGNVHNVYPARNPELRNFNEPERVERTPGTKNARGRNIGPRTKANPNLHAPLYRAIDLDWDGTSFKFMVNPEVLTTSSTLQDLSSDNVAKLEMLANQLNAKYERRLTNLVHAYSHVDPDQIEPSYEYSANLFRTIIFQNAIR
jgi:hypothetical protein